MFDDSADFDRPRTLASSPPILHEYYRRRLRQQLQRLKLIEPVICVTVMALKHQNAELDDEMAVVLHRHAVDPLGAEIEEIEALLEMTDPARRVQEVAG